MNLPVFTMLNKSARQLVHFHLITHKIDYQKREVKVKCYFHQLNQASGKSYWKCPRVKINNRVRKLSYLNFGLPSQELIQEYEGKKQKFVSDLANDFMAELDKLERIKLLKLSRKDLTQHQQQVFNMVLQGSTQEEIARLKHITQQSVAETVKAIKKKGYSLENSINRAVKPNPPPI